MPEAGLQGQKLFQKEKNLNIKNKKRNKSLISLRKPFSCLKKHQTERKCSLQRNLKDPRSRIYKTFGGWRMGLEVKRHCLSSAPSTTGGLQLSLQGIQSPLLVSLGTHTHVHILITRQAYNKNMHAYMQGSWVWAHFHITSASPAAVREASPC